MERTKLDGSNFRTVFVLLLVLGVSVLFIAVVWPFLQTLLMGAILAGFSRPIFHMFVRLFHGRRGLASAATVFLLVVLLLGPLSAFLALVVQQALEISNQVIPQLQYKYGDASAFDAHKWVVERFPLLRNFVPSSEEIINSMGTAAKTSGGWLATGVSALTVGTAGFLLNFFVMLYAIFFFLKDGKKILERIFYYMPLGSEDEGRMLERFISVTRATVKGTLLIGLIQGVLAAAGFYFAGISGVALWGTVMVLLSVIPGIGSALIWVPAVLYLYLTGQTLAATLLGIWCAGVVGTIDNILRPRLVGQDARMPDLLILLGTLGGLFLFGPVGFIIGPIICGLFLTVWEIYGETFKHILPPSKSMVTAAVPLAAKGPPTEKSD